MVATDADDARIITPERVCSGKDVIRDFAEEWVREFSQPEISVETGAIVIDGDTGLVVWHGSLSEDRYDFAADTYVAEHCKIVSHTFAGKIEPR